jgi:hypothetical protein
VITRDFTETTLIVAKMGLSVIADRLVARYKHYIPVAVTSGSMLVRAFFPILGAYLLSQEDYVTAVAFVGILGISGLITGFEFHAVIIREFTTKISSARYRHRAALKNLATAIPRVLFSCVFLYSVIWPVIENSVFNPLITIPLIPILIYLDLLLCEASRIHNAAGEFVAGTILTNVKNIAWLFFLPVMLWFGCSVIDGIVLSYASSLLVLSLVFTSDFKGGALISLPKYFRKNLRRSIVILKGSRFLLLVGWIGLLSPMIERYFLAISQNFEFATSFFFMGSLAAIASVLSTNVALTPFHKIMLSPGQLGPRVVVSLFRRVVTTCLIVSIIMISMFIIIPPAYFPEGVSKSVHIFVPLLIGGQILVMGNFFSLRLYSAKADKKLLLISGSEFFFRVSSVVLLTEYQYFKYIPVGFMFLAGLMFLWRFYSYFSLNLDRHVFGISFSR